MFLPFHQYASVPIAADATAVHRRLILDVQDRLATATAHALTALGPRVAAWGMTASALPTTTARTTGPDELGVAEITWRGDEAATGWPALSGRLVVTPQPGERSRLLFLSRRSPRAELATSGLDRLHRHRVVEVSIQGFLNDLGHQFDSDTATSTAIGAGARSFDDRPLFLHHLEDLEVTAALTAALADQLPTTPAVVAGEDRHLATATA